MILRENNNLIVPIITPRHNSKIDMAGLEKMIEFLVTGGVDSIFILGTTGEFGHLSQPEKLVIIEASYRKIEQRVPLLIGVSAATIEQTRELVRATSHLRFAALVLAPLFGEGDAETKIEIALENSNLPIFLYNNPAIHGNENLDLGIIEKYAAHNRVVGAKDSSGDEDYFKKLVSLSSESFFVLQGSETQYLKSPGKAKAGLVSGSANIYPSEFRKLLDDTDEQMIAEITELKNDLKEISPNAIKGIKIMLTRRGVIASDELYG